MEYLIFLIICANTILQGLAVIFLFKRISMLKDTIKEQSGYISMIKDFAGLLSVDEFKKHIELRLESKEMEIKKLLEDSRAKNIKAMAALTALFIEEPELFLRYKNEFKFAIKNLNPG